MSYVPGRNTQAPQVTEAELDVSLDFDIEHHLAAMEYAAQTTESMTQADQEAA